MSYVLKPVRITPSAVYIDGQRLPDAIEEDGVTVKPGGHKAINKLTVTFIVGDVEILDPTNDYLPMGGDYGEAGEAAAEAFRSGVKKA